MTTVGRPQQVLKRLFDGDLPPEGGACAETDPALFYPEKGENGNVAKLICRGCPVVAACLEWALLHDERFGVWGGTSAAEREKIMRRSRRKGLSPVDLIG